MGKDPAAEDAAVVVHDLLGVEILAALAQGPFKTPDPVLMGLESFGDRKPVERGAPFGACLVLLTAEDSVKPVDDFHDVGCTQEV